MVQRMPPVDVREVHVFTTGAGERKVKETLLGPRDGWFARLCRDFGVGRGRIRFGASTLHVLRDSAGRPVEDVRTPEDNVRLADELLALVRELTRDPGIAVHASVAGGRKTMGLLLGIILQLFARPQDRLSHVLISPPDLENCPDFYYPPPAPTMVNVKKKSLSTAQARVELIEIPILRLREKLRGLDLEHLSYRELVAQGQLEIDRLIRPPALVLRSAQRILEVGGTRLALTPVELAVFRLLAERRLACGKPACPGCKTCGLEAGDFDKAEVRTELARHLQAVAPRDDRARALAGWRDAAYKRFREVRAHVNGKIRGALGSGQWVGRYLIAATGKRPDTRYQLPLDPAHITIE
jgi:CRISPR-associated protein (TIGR02584 family)